MQANTLSPDEKHLWNIVFFERAPRRFLIFVLKVRAALFRLNALEYCVFRKSAFSSIYGLDGICIGNTIICSDVWHCYAAKCNNRRKM